MSLGRRSLPPIPHERSRSPIRTRPHGGSRESGAHRQARDPGLPSGSRVWHRPAHLPKRSAPEVRLPAVLLDRFRPGGTRRDWTNTAALAAYVLVAFVLLGLRFLVEPGEQLLRVRHRPEDLHLVLRLVATRDLARREPVCEPRDLGPERCELDLDGVDPGSCASLRALDRGGRAGRLLQRRHGAAARVLLWTAFVLCRHLTKAVWPAVVGGYLFGFSSYGSARRRAIRMCRRCSSSRWSCSWSSASSRAS